MSTHYDKDRDNAALGKFYTDHVSAMTREGLHKKSDIASELAVRDARIAELERDAERIDAQWRDELRIYRESEDARIAELDGLLADAGEVVADAARYLAIDPRGQETELARLNALSAAIDAARANGGEW